MIFLILGILGMSLILLAFIMADLKKWKHSSLKYAAANTIGSMMMCVYAAYLHSWPFLILNLIWAVISIRDVVIGSEN